MNTRNHRSVLILGCIFILAAAGSWISGELVKEHAGRWTVGGANGGLFTRVCEATTGAGFDCRGAISGPWSTIHIPVPVPSRSSVIGLHRVTMPVAFMGLAYFVFMGVWFAIVGRPKTIGYRWHRIPLGIGLCGLAVSIFYMGVMATGTAPWCAWCLALHAINLLLVLAIWRLRGQRVSNSVPASAHLSRGTTTFRQVATALTVAMILITGLWAYRHEQLAFRKQLRKLQPYKTMVTSFQEDPTFLLREYYAQPRREIPSRSEEQTDGSRPQLAVFTDFECPECYCNSLQIRSRIADSFDGQLSVQVRHYPLDSKCNPNVETEMHPNACSAAYAAEAARMQGGDEAFKRMYRLLFRNTKVLGEDLYRMLAERIGLDPDRLMRDMQDDEIRAVIQSDIRLAESLQVTGTPTMFLDGRRITALLRTPTFWKVAAQNRFHPEQQTMGSVSESRSILATADLASSRKE